MRETEREGERERERERREKKLINEFNSGSDYEWDCISKSLDTLWKDQNEESKAERAR